MIEMLGVLAIIAVLSVGGIAGYSKAITKFKTNQIADQVTTIVTHIKTLYAQQKDYSGLWRYDGTDDLKFSNPFGGGSITIRPASSVGTSSNDDTAFMIYYRDIPKDACIALATNDWGNSAGLIALEVSGSFSSELDWYKSIGCSGGVVDVGPWTLTIGCPKGSVISLPMSPARAAQACSCNEGDTCQVSWKYY